MNYAKTYGLKAGDKIVLPLFQTGLSKHHAIYLWTDEFGQEWIAENRIFKGVQIVDADSFFAGVNVIDRIDRFEGNSYQRDQAIHRALSLVGKPYNLLTYNCEHYANEVQTGQPYSPQVKNTVLLLGSFLLARAIIRQ